MDSCESDDQQQDDHGKQLIETMKKQKDTKRTVDSGFKKKKLKIKKKKTQQISSPWWKISRDISSTFSPFDGSGFSSGLIGWDLSV